MELYNLKDPWELPNTFCWSWEDRTRDLRNLVQTAQTLDPVLSIASLRQHAYQVGNYKRPKASRQEELPVEQSVSSPPRGHRGHLFTVILDSRKADFFCFLLSGETECQVRVNKNWQAVFWDKHGVRREEQNSLITKGLQL